MEEVSHVRAACSWDRTFRRIQMSAPQPDSSFPDQQVTQKSSARTSYTRSALSSNFPSPHPPYILSHTHRILQLEARCAKCVPKQAILTSQPLDAKTGGEMKWIMLSVLGVHWKDWCWSWNSNTLATWCKKQTHLKRPWCWERLRAGREGDDKGWDGWMASSTQWTWVWVNSRSWWQTGRPGMWQSVGSQRVRHDWETELNWTEHCEQASSWNTLHPPWCFKSSSTRCPSVSWWVMSTQIPWWMWHLLGFPNFCN